MLFRSMERCQGLGCKRLKNGKNRNIPADKILNPYTAILAISSCLGKVSEVELMPDSNTINAPVMI